MDINVEKFVKNHRRMCNAYYGCDGCPAKEMNYDGDCYNISILESIAPIVQEWAEEYSVKTYLNDMKEKFPNMVIGELFYSRYCVQNFYGEECKPHNGCDISICKKCWNREMEE